MSNRFVVKCMYREFYSVGNGKLYYPSNTPTIISGNGDTAHILLSNKRLLKKYILQAINHSFITDFNDWVDLVNIGSCLDYTYIKTSEIFDLENNPIYNRYLIESWKSGITDVCYVVERNFAIFLDDKPIGVDYLREVLNIKSELEEMDLFKKCIWDLSYGNADFGGYI